jgi:hypothetical protein
MSGRMQSAIDASYKSEKRRRVAGPTARHYYNGSVMYMLVDCFTSG